MKGPSPDVVARAIKKQLHLPNGRSNAEAGVALSACTDTGRERT